MVRINKLLLILLVLVSAVCRLWNIQDYLTFLGDEGRDVTIVSNIIKGNKYTLIGPGTSIGNMYLGPWYYYLLIPSLGLANFSPVGPAIMVALIGVITVVAIWYIARLWFGQKIAFMVAYLYALSPTVIVYSRSSWNPNIMPFFALLSIYSIWVIYKYQRYQYFYVLAFALLMVLNSHYLGLLLIPPIALFLWFVKKNSLINKHLIYSSLLLIMLMSPIIIFDARHGWQNFESFKKFVTVRQETVNLKPYKAIPNLWPIYTQINSSLLLAKQNQYSSLLSLLLVLSIIYYTFSDTRITSQVRLMLLWLVSGLIGLGLYKQHIYDHYFGFLFPVVFLSLALIFKMLGQKYSVILFGFLLSVNLLKNPLLSEPNRQLARTKLIAEYINNNAIGNYNLALLSNHNYDASYRYFLNNNYKTLHQEITSQLYVICETDPCDPINNPLWEIAGFGWSKIDQVKTFPWGVKLYKLIHNPSGQS